MKNLLMTNSIKGARVGNIVVAAWASRQHHIYVMNECSRLGAENTVTAVAVSLQARYP